MAETLSGFSVDKFSCGIIPDTKLQSENAYGIEYVLYTKFIFLEIDRNQSSFILHKTR